MQYPAGQRPCTEALNSLGAVTQAQLDAGPGPNDPDGEVRDALRHAKDGLTTHRAGESAYYSAAQYQALAATVADQIDPLIDAYDREDPDTPYTEAMDYYHLSDNYDAARNRLDDECNGRNPGDTR